MKVYADHSFLRTMLAFREYAARNFAPKEYQYALSLELALDQRRIVTPAPGEEAPRPRWYVVSRALRTMEYDKVDAFTSFVITYSQQEDFKTRKEAVRMLQAVACLLRWLGHDVRTAVDTRGP